MKTIEELSSKTSELFESKIELPEPPLNLKKQLEAYESENLEVQRHSLIFKIRQWQAENLGFQKLSFQEMAQMITGESFNYETEGERKNWDWGYNHHTDSILPNSWGAKEKIFERRERGKWFMPPYSPIVKWRLKYGFLNHLKREIPVGVVYKIKECKLLKLFNSFAVIAPEEAWVSNQPIDPIVIGVISELPYSPGQKRYKHSGEEILYFIAQW